MFILKKAHHSSCSSDDDLNDDLTDDEFENEDSAYEELQRKKTHPWRLHDELWYNDKGEVIECFFAIFHIIEVKKFFFYFKQTDE